MRWWRPGGASVPSPYLFLFLSWVSVYTLLAPILVLFYPIIVLDPPCARLHHAPLVSAFYLNSIYPCVCMCVCGYGACWGKGGGGAVLSALLPSPPASAPFPLCESVFVFFQYLNHILLVPLLAHPSYFQLFFTNIKSPYICTHLRRKKELSTLRARYSLPGTGWAGSDTSASTRNTCTRNTSPRTVYRPCNHGVLYGHASSCRGSCLGLIRHHGGLGVS